MAETRRVIYQEPVYNEETRLWEVRKEDEREELIELLAEESREELERRREQLIKDHILAQLGSLKKEKQASDKEEELANTEELTEEEITEEVLRRKVEGEQLTDIVGEVCKEHDLSTARTEEHLTYALSKIKGRAEEVARETLETHTSRYESLYRWFREHGFSRHALKTLRAKEALLGVGQDLFTVQLSNHFEVIERRNTLNINKLSKEEYDKMKRLVSKLNLPEGNKEEEHED